MTLTVEHKCAGPDCLHCAMLHYGYVRSAVIDRWMKPNDPRAPLLTDDEAWGMLQMRLIEEVSSAIRP